MGGSSFALEQSLTNKVRSETCSNILRLVFRSYKKSWYNKLRRSKKMFSMTLPAENGDSARMIEGNRSMNYDRGPISFS